MKAPCAYLVHVFKTAKSLNLRIFWESTICHVTFLTLWPWRPGVIESGMNRYSSTKITIMQKLKTSLKKSQRKIKSKCYASCHYRKCISYLHFRHHTQKTKQNILRKIVPGILGGYAASRWDHGVWPLVGERVTVSLHDFFLLVVQQGLSVAKGVADFADQ